MEVETHSFGKVDGNKVFKNGKVGKDLGFRKKSSSVFQWMTWACEWIIK